MTRSLLQRAAAVGGAAAVLTLLVASPAAAHVTVSSPGATQGGYATVTFKVPNESDTASTTKLEVTLPADTPFASVSVRPVPGWTAVAVKTKLAKPIEAHGSQLTEAVSKITWTASGDAAVKPNQFQAFDVSVGPLPQTDQVVFKALQTYSDGNVVRWIEEPAADGTESESPAPVLKLAPAAAADAPVSASVAPLVSDARGEESDTGMWFGLAGLVLGLAGLVAGLLAYRRASQVVPAPASASSAASPVKAGADQAD
jgi:uncharacterized protein YcnI